MKKLIFYYRKNHLKPFRNIEKTTRKRENKQQERFFILAWSGSGSGPPVFCGRVVVGCMRGYDFWSSKAFELGDHLLVQLNCVLVHFQIVRISIFGPVCKSGPKLCIWTFFNKLIKNVTQSSDHKFPQRNVSWPKLQWAKTAIAYINRHVRIFSSWFTGPKIMPALFRGFSF